MKKVFFSNENADLVARNGQQVKVIKELGSNEHHLGEEFPGKRVYLVSFPDGYTAEVNEGELKDLPIMVIETEIWEPENDKPSLLRKVRSKTIGEVLDETIAFLKEQDLLKDLDYFLSEGMPKDNEEFPEYEWISCYAVTGDSEGHYIHVDVIENGNRKNIFIGKTFLGMDTALKVSNMLTKVFYIEMKTSDIRKIYSRYMQIG